MGRIFVPVTGPMETKKAINKAVSLAKLMGFSLTVMYTIDRESVARLERFKVFISEEANYLTDGMKRDADKYLSYARKTGETVGVAVDTIVLEGDPVEEFSRTITQSPETTKLVCVARKSDGDFIKDYLGTVEKRLFQKFSFDFLIAGADL